METAKILVVEDDADINGLLTTILKKQGYEVTSAFSGSEAGRCVWAQMTLSQSRLMWRK